ncbi:Transcriptional regulator [Sulfidibacter corallicola]|uniref:Zinc ribbon domain-containing protein n=1 Tax=Sulfidibacter corallicola TaxID=2818388 RepID=A0A8A4TUA2_SULCO|nr:hypothetical protein [Sulfidibacter corallicola]QTD53546.1 hypothetical protein J3U87_13910 [Sulfidibacter corallicola]
MPTYEYRCAENGVMLEVLHGMNHKVTRWGELCELAGVPTGETSPDAPVERLISAPGLAFPKTTSELKNMGFTKLVKRDTGVYENVTATDKEARYTVAGKPETMPDFKGRIGD